MPRNLDLTALRSFVTVADSGGVTRAAGQLNVTQSAVSMQLKRLEESLDQKLLDRSQRQIGLTPGSLAALNVAGDSMEPVLHDGDEILVDTRQQPFRDGIHVVRLDDTLLVKRVASQGGGRFSLLSQNLSYPPVAVDGADLTIVGRVVWKGGRL